MANSEQLTLGMLFARAEQLFPESLIVSRESSGVTRLQYRDFTRRTRALAGALGLLSVAKGDRVGTVAWNTHRHLEAYFAVPLYGAVLHTINFRLPIEQFEYVINHAEDQVLLVEAEFLPLVESVWPRLRSVRAVVVLAGPDEVPASDVIKPLYSYEALLEQAGAGYDFQPLDERDPAGMCYTSATTGLPKGVVYSHRTLVMHTYANALGEVMVIRQNDVGMPVVPMFHVNAWGQPFTLTAFGSTQVYPGPRPTPADLVKLIADEGVTFAAGVPTIWIGVLRELDRLRDAGEPVDISKWALAISGGSASPKELIRRYLADYGVEIVQGYGMTETTPLTHLCRLLDKHKNLSLDEQMTIRAKQGRPVLGVQMRVVRENGTEAARDGREAGELWLRGPWIAEEYYKDERSAASFVDGWLRTGDIVTVDADGYMEIVDRTKDVIKSGGEWISSVALENAIMAHPGVFEAAVIAKPNVQWAERPLACVVLKPGVTLSADEVIDFLKEQVPKWWLPDEVLFLDEIPKTGVGKFAKRVLRERILH